jgi:transcriptional regulator with XRE-family HTH domain
MYFRTKAHFPAEIPIADVAAAAGVARQTWARWEGGANMTTANLLAACDALGRTPETIFGKARELAHTARA